MRPARQLLFALLVGLTLFTSLIGTGAAKVSPGCVIDHESQATRLVRALDTAEPDSTVRASRPHVDTNMIVHDLIFAGLY